MRRAPGNLLHPDPDPGVGALEIAGQLLHHFALAAEGPEAEGRIVGGGAGSEQRG